MTTVAAVDVGTNSVRLLVAAVDAGSIEPLERLMTITRLGAGVDANGRLDDAALERTLACLDRYAERWQALDAERVRIAATSAVRDAEDRRRFFDGVAERTGVAARVLSGEEEARLAFAGATAQVDQPGPHLVVDIGGGSTELILGHGSVHAAVSRQLGCVRLTERCLPSDPPTAAELMQARRAVDSELDAVSDALDAASARTLIGVAGTVTTLAALHLGLADYEPDRIHGTRVPLDSVSGLTERLAAMPAAQRAELGPMAPGREDVIVGGAVILARVMQRYGFDAVVASEADILDGLALELASGRS